MPTAPTLQQLSNIEIGCQVVQKPDGDHWIVLAISTMLNQYTLLVSPELAENIAEALPGNLRQAIAQAKQANTGLVIAGPADLKNGKLT